MQSEAGMIKRVALEWHYFGTELSLAIDCQRNVWSESLRININSLPRYPLQI